LLFTALSLADLTLTWVLLERAKGCASESNPVASWCLARFGLPGLAGFKGGSVLVLTTLVLFVARHRPRAACRVLVFGCATLLAVVLYSGALVYRVEVDVPAFARAQEMAQDLERKEDRFRAYLALRDRLRDDLVARRCTLAEAVERLAAAECVQDAQLLRVARPGGRPDGTLRECLAERLVAHALGFGEAGAAGSELLARQLNAQLLSCFSRPPLSAPADAGAFCLDCAFALCLPPSAGMASVQRTDQPREPCYCVRPSPARPGDPCDAH